VHMPAVLERGTIVLRTQASISGFVKLRDGTVPDSTLFVFANPGRTRPECAEVSNPVKSSSLHFAKTDATGFFRIDGLERERAYRLTGAGSGFVVSEQDDVVPSAQLALLQARALYGVRFVVLAEDGSPLSAPADLYADQSLEASCADPTVTAVNPANELLFAGVTGVDCVEVERQDSITLLYAGDSAFEAVGPVRITVARPGHQRTARSALAQRVRQSVAQVELRMVADPVPCGSIEVRLSPVELAAGANLGVSLRGVQGTGFFISLASATSSSHVIHGVPSDDYTYEVTGFDKLLRRKTTPTGEPLRISVLPERTATLEIDLSQERVLEVELRDELGLAMEGPLLLRLRSEGPRAMIRHIPFMEAPYRLLAVPDGPITLSAMAWAGGATRPGQEDFLSRITLGPPEAFQKVVLTSKLQRVAELRRD
jgi:hypothetical protein